ncbi:zf-CCHC domain-containing protein [Tanacetum coccineum]
MDDLEPGDKSIDTPLVSHFLDSGDDYDDGEVLNELEEYGARIPSTSSVRLIELENQVQCLMEVHLAPKQPVQVNKITSLCEICSGPHDTRYCMENPEQAFAKYTSSRTDEAGDKWYTFKPGQNNLGDTHNPSWKSHPTLRWRQPQSSQNNFSNPLNPFQPNGSFPNRSFNNNPQNFNNQSNLEGLMSNFMASQNARLSKFEADFKQQQSEMTNKIDTVLKAITDRMTRALPSDTKNDDSREEEHEVDENAEARELEVEYFDIFPTRSDLAYHKGLPSPAVLGEILEHVGVGDSQVKDNKIDLLVQQYEPFTILEEESIDSGFVTFNTTITSLKALDEGFSSKNYVRKFLRALHPKWRAKVTTIEESKDLSSLALDELIDNLKVHEVVIKKDSEIYKGKKERVKSIALKAKKEFIDDETLTSRSNDKEYAMAVRNFKKFFRRKGKSDRKCFRCDDPNHLIGDCPKPPRNKDQKAFVGGCWSDSENEAEDKINDETCLMAQSSNENSQAYIILNKHTMKVKESLNVTFNESPPPTKLSPLVDDDVGEEEAIENNIKVVNNNNIEEESVEVDEVVNIKESKNHPLEQVIGNLNQRT